MEVEVEKKLFLSCLKEKLCIFKIFTGEEQGQVAFCFDVSHMNLDIIALKQLRTMYILFDPAGGRDCFFFSHCCCENFDELLQAQISGCGIALRNLQQGFQIERRQLNSDISEQLAEMREIEGFKLYRGELFLSSDDKIAALSLLVSSLISEVELLGQMQFKPAVIFLNRLVFREILQNEPVLTEYLVKIVWKVGQQWQEISSAYLLQTLKEIEHQLLLDIISVIKVEYYQLSHLVQLQPSQGKYHDQLKLFWPLQDLTDHSSPYNILSEKQSCVELKPGQHIFFRQGAISFLRSSQIHGIYLGKYQVLSLQPSEKQELKIDAIPLDIFQKDSKQILNVCEYGMPDLDSLFRRSGSYSKSSSDHPFKVLLRAQLILSLKNPIRFALKDTEVDEFAKIIKTGQCSNIISDDFAFFVEQVVSAFCDTFFVSLGE